MPECIYIYETRKLDYLDLYLRNALEFGIKTVVLDESILEASAGYKEFQSVYEHLSDNPFGFEMSCFARYFAIAEVHKENSPFILSDSDILLLPPAKQFFGGATVTGTFIGSEGYDGAGSESQISPHFSFWDRSLLNDFIEFLITEYKANREDRHLVEEFTARKKRFERTGISDMTLLHSWVRKRSVPFVNSNSVNSWMGIDHNISALYAEGGGFKQSWGRKRLLSRAGEVYLSLVDGRVVKPAVLHFQGRYKIALMAFAGGNRVNFFLRSVYIQTGRKVRSILFRSQL